MKEKKLLGIDLGTAGCKAIILSSGGQILGESYSPYPLIKLSSSMIEQDVNEWWKSTKEATLSVIKESKVKPAEIAALSISSQGISFVPVDKKGNPLTNAVTWLDTRSLEEVKQIENKYTSQEIFNITAKRISPAYVLPKLLWGKKHEPTVFEDTNKFLMGQDFLIHRLSGKFITDHSMAAGTLLYDIKKQGWSQELLDTFHISRDKLPDIRRAGTSLGKIGRQVAMEMGLSEETEVIIGGQDQKCAALGAGIDRTKATISLGTASAISVMTDEPIIDRKERIPCFPFVIPGMYILEGVVSSAGASLEWFKEIFSPAKGYDELDSMCQKSKVGAEGVFFYPHLTGATSPHWQPEAKGVFYGLTLSVKKEDMIRALLEGIAFQIKENLDVLEELTPPLKKIVLFGGGANNVAWASMISNITNKSVFVPRTVETAALGSAILAGVGSRIYDTYEEAQRVVSKDVAVRDPEEALVKQYQKIYRKYLRIEKKIIL